MKKFLLTTVLMLLVSVAAQAAFPFQTTSSPTALPVHWYYLKANDKFVGYDPVANYGNQIKLTTKALNYDTYLWCFVEVSSDKVVLYNKSAKRYFLGASYFTTDIDDSSISFCMEKDDASFYVKYRDVPNNMTFYLYEYVSGDTDIFSSSGAKYDACIFSVVEVVVEENKGPIADQALTGTDAYTPHNDSKLVNERYPSLFDKDKSTKWFVDNNTGSWETIWVDFKSEVAFVPTSYTMSTASDTYSCKGRNPKKWKIYAKVNESDSWTTIVNVTDGAAAGLGVYSSCDYSFGIYGLNTKYQYFRFEVSEVCGKGGWGTDHYEFQLAELALSGYSSEGVKGDVNGDTQVTATDIACVVNVLAGLEDASIYEGRADVTGDGGAVTAADIAAIVNILAGLD